MELVKGQIVTSRAGRDVTHVYMVAGLEGDRVLLADGAKRPLNEPKRKNIRHIAPTRTVLAAGEAETDLQLKKALAAYVKERDGIQEGG